MSDTTNNPPPPPPTSPVPPGPPSSNGTIPPHIEIAIFKRFWIWLASLSAFIVALVGLVGALSLAELKEYAKEAANNKAYEEWKNIRSETSKEMDVLRNELDETTAAASKAVQDSRERVGEANEVSKSAHKIATDVEGELKQLEGNIKSAGDVFAAKTELENAISKEVSSPSFQATFGAKIDTFQSNFQAKLDGLTKRFEDSQTRPGVSQVGIMSCYKKFSTAGATDNGTQLVVEFTNVDCHNIQPKQGWTYVGILSGTTICGGYSEYVISETPFIPFIHFYGPKFCKADDSEVWVHWVGVSPRAF